MKKLSLLLCLMLVGSVVAFGQSREDRVKRSTELLTKIRKIDLLNQILPVAMNKKQLNDILSALDKVKINVERQEKAELDQMIKLEGELDSSIKGGTERGEIPKKEFTEKLAKTFRALDIVRAMAIQENIDTVAEAMKKTLNAGQLKAAAHAISMAFFDPDLKPEEITEQKRLDTYVKYVLLDPLAYSVLNEMFKAAKPSN